MLRISEDWLIQLEYPVKMRANGDRECLKLEGWAIGIFNMHNTIQQSGRDILKSLKSLEELQTWGR